MPLSSLVHLLIPRPGPAYICWNTHPQTHTFPSHKHTDTQIPAKCCGRWPTLLSPSSNYPRRDPVSTTTAAMMPLPWVAFLFSLAGRQWDSKWSLKMTQVLEFGSCYSYEHRFISELPLWCLWEWLKKNVIISVKVRYCSAFEDMSNTRSRKTFWLHAGTAKGQYAFTKKYEDISPLHVSPVPCFYDHFCPQEIFSVPGFLSSLFLPPLIEVSKMHW